VVPALKVDTIPMKPKVQMTVWATMSSIAWH